ncbi:MAG: transglutaminase domain-containing protein, partial [Solirubrobacterales bacterium]|nr:transglutaminase domain-containing protein [Solirubrobacterales bacterium]
PKAWSGEYWKAENLDSFDGRGWIPAALSAGGEPALSAATLARWTQTLTVSIRAMQTTEIIAAGTAQAPTHVAAPLPGWSAGTWISPTALGPGATYQVQVYAPHPTPARLARAGDSDPLEVRRVALTLALPQVQASSGAPDQTVLFPAFGSRHIAPQDLTDPATISGTAAIAGSPYDQTYALAQRMARTSRTPYAYVQRVLGYLDSGLFTYNEYPPTTAFPLETFLFQSHLGYCQQFAGAMALLLRMGGVPARVATGFTTGTYDTATKRWLVSDLDAHAWVEVWFPEYGWITFDPTPAAAPARGGHAAISSSGLLGSTAGLSKLGGREAGLTGAVGTAGVRRHSGGSAAPFLLGTLGLLAALLALALLAWRRSGPLDADGLLAELERALARSGRPVSDGVTLAALEHRFRTSPAAASYLRTLRMSRFAGEDALPTLGQRRALRAQLRAGLGLGGALRALWALPPRPQHARGLGRPRPGNSA